MLYINSTQPDYWEQAVSDLKKKDRILSRIIPLYSEKRFLSSDSPFITLAHAIISQQISSKLAGVVWDRFVKIFGRLPSPRDLIFAKGGELNSIGIPKRKVEYLHDLAYHFYENKVSTEKLINMDDESIISELSSIKGIGRWTAEMFLIFNLRRPDVMPLDDVGLIRAISIHYFSGEPVSRFEAREVSGAWRPWRTVASWYLWRSIEK
ncbi:DNA-3-methyladenine glycosylase II [Candidatus Kinetoplastibacterium blastocrithidii TCC012E]|uniref:DNA-3-methyladenine glycosylase II n=1 Tax=Candidatus Kinetoplastidibacterium blastocrithidiae TCC012E TaxID=1208922 RepID=M1LVM8_9PROT|nr:DNA-3-methyladenine glycosylase [Candidatus Kinetoplastibacterium blastocrithidii]AFZ83510.1 DNA-3-methyladenine glucosyllase II [Candidatus Kinetoplastibacterium blastocrithidii (ex Strigomonas culicis)]AGF49607.1 DNA-3-methyladenine glycosylase II [Candidatus Kinetoplastibacterium blastocrithidii TCC012E]